MKRLVSTTISAALIGVGLVAGAAAPASAAPNCNDTTQYSIGNKKTVWRTTQVHSDWAKPGVTISYAKNKTGSVTATGTVTLGAEAGVVFSKASTSFSVSVGKTWSKSDTWTYSAKVKKKAGKSRGRLMMYHEAKGFSVTKWRWVPSTTSCKKKVYWKKSNIVAPVKKNSNLWGIQYK